MILYTHAFWRRPVAAIILILVVGAAVYANTFQAPFTFDDKWSIVGNPDIRSLENFTASPTRFIGYLTFALNYRFGGLDVTGYHTVNLLIHLTAAVLVYAFLRLTLRTPFFSTLNPQPSTGDARVALIPLIAALLFVAHPVQTQAVTYIVQRLTSLATLFYLLSVLLYVQARLSVDQNSEFRIQNSGENAPSFRVFLLFAGSVLSAILAMKTKEIAFTLPLAVLLYEIFFFHGNWKRRLLCLLPLLATLPLVPISVFFTGDSAGDVLSDIGEKSRVFAGMSRLDYLFTQFRVIVTYLRLLVLPIDQNVDYDYPVYTTFFTPPVFLSFLLLAGLFALAIYLFYATRRAAGPTSTLNDPVLRLISFGSLWFFLTLAVESSVIPIQDVIFEHRLYLPGLGAATVFAATLSLLAERFFRQSAGRWFVTAAVLIITGLAVATIQRNQVWGSELRLWQDAAAKSPQKARTLNNFAVALEADGRRAEAVQVLSRAIQVDPTYYKAYYNLADLYLVSDQPEKSLPLLQTAIRMKPDFTEAYVKMGAALLRGGNFREVIAFFERNLDRVGGHPEAHFYLGSAYAFLGQREAAQRQLAILSRLDAKLAASLTGLLGRNAPHGLSHGRN